MSTQIIVKRQHHHVWANYLKRWAFDGTNIHHTTKKRNLATNSIKAVAKEQDFYKLTRLTEEDIFFIKKFSQQSDKSLQKLHLNQLNLFLLAQKSEDRIRSNRSYSAEAKKAIDSLYSNLLEDHHGLHERRAAPILKTLATGDMSILNDKNNMLKFMCFLGHQISRTKNMRDSVIPRLIRGSDLANRLSDSMTKAWWFYSYMFGMNIGQSLFVGRNTDTHSLLINDTSTPFITADQPIINVHPDIPDAISNTPPTHADFYYPISPRVAYTIFDSNRYAAGVVHVQEADVILLNTQMAKNSQTFIFSNNRETLAPLLKYVGCRKFKDGL